MVIAVHIHSNLLAASQLFQAVKFLAQQHPSTKFIVLMTEPSIKEPVPSNIQFSKINNTLTSNLRIHFWYNYRLPLALKKIKADIFISEAGIASLKSQVPQWLWITNTSFLDKRSIHRNAADGYRRKHFARFLQASTGVLVREEYMTGQIIKQYHSNTAKFHFMGEFLYDIFKPVEWEAKNEFLESFSGGTQYFYCECSALTRRNITSVLKAFSLFKKRLKSGMKLVLNFYDVSLEDCVKDFHLYKYRHDVIVEKYSNPAYKPGQLIASAYAAIYLPTEIRGNDHGLEALHSAVPLICTDEPEHHSIYKDAALLCQPGEQSIADNMMLLYKDEQLRSDLILKGLELAKRYELPAIAERTWQAIATS